jgi:hypothetical protein
MARDTASSRDRRVTVGTPEQVARIEASYTGQALRPVLAATRANGAE